MQRRSRKAQRTQCHTFAEGPRRPLRSEPNNEVLQPLFEATEYPKRISDDIARSKQLVKKKLRANISTMSDDGDDDDDDEG